MNRTLVDTLDEALRPYMSDSGRRRFVCERVAPVIAGEFLRRLDEALSEVPNPTLKEGKR